MQRVVALRRRSHPELVFVGWLEIRSADGLKLSAGG